MTSWVQDLRQAVRSVRRQRLVSGLAIVAFALGIGVTTAVFSIFNSVLLTPLDYPDSDRLVLVYDTQPSCDTCPASFPKYHDWRSRSGHLFSAIGGATTASFVLTGTGDPDRVRAIRMTASMAQVLGVPPMMGRWPSDEDDQPGGPKVAAISHAFWQARFGGDPGVLGQTMMLDGESVQVIGVLPDGFEYRSGELFVPLQRALDPGTRGSHFLPVMARLKDDVTVERATIEMREIGNALALEFGHNHGVDVRSYYEAVVGRIRSPLQMLMVAVLLVLFIACANVANLLLAAGMARRRELAIRLAMGARRIQLVRLMVAEGIVLAGIGGALGVMLAQWAVVSFVALAGNQLPRGSSVQVDGRVVLFAAGVTLGVGILCGVWPLLRMKTRELAATVREADTRTASGGGGRFGNGLVVAEIAIACALLVGAGLLVKNLTRLQGREAGLRSEGVVTFDLQPAGARYENEDVVRTFYRDLLTRLSAVGGVAHVGVTSHLPMYNFGYNGDMNREGGNPWGPNDAPLVEYRWYGGDYFQALEIPLLRGRFLDDRDRTGSLTVLINKTMADKFWPGEDPLGKKFGQDSDHSQWWEVVGVVGDTRSSGLTRVTPPEFYRTIEQSAFAAMTVVMTSTTDDPGALVPTARQVVSSLDPSLPVTAVQNMNQVVADSVGQPRFLTALSSLFGTLAGLLAIVGVYGVMTYNVRRQRREFGIRLALGAGTANVKRLVIGRGLLLAVSGVAIGLFGAYGISRGIASQLTDIEAADPSVFAGIAIAVLLVTCVASWLPARQASRVDPGEALRDS